MKRFIVIISAFFCLSMAQDIAGSWTLTAVDVWYYNFARPNPETADEAFGENQYATPLYVSDSYGMGVSLPLAWLPPGYMFLGVPNGPFGEGGLAANGVNLNVTLETDGTGTIPEGSNYPDIELDEELCVTYGQVLPVTDDVRYSSNLDAGVTLPATDIVGKPSRNNYAGDVVGTMSLTQSVVFSFFPELADHDYSPMPLYFADGSAGTEFTQTIGQDELGNEVTLGYKTVGTTGGYIKTDGFNGSIGDSDELTVGDNPTPELALYWHSMDGFSADTGLGDFDFDYPGGPGDEDGDGTPYDRIFGLPAISSTKIDPGLAYSLGFGTDFGHHVAGDIQAPLQDLLYGGCLQQVAAGAYDGCISSVYNTVMAQCADAGGPVNAVTGLCFDASQTPEFAGACGAYGAAGALTATCLQLGFSEEVCSDAATQAAPAVDAYCAYATGGAAANCDEAGIDPCTVLTNPEFSLGLCGTLAAGLTESETCTEWVDSFYDYDEDPDSPTYGEVIGESFFDANAAQSETTGFQSCTDFSAGLALGLAAGDPVAIGTLDALAAASSATGYSTCSVFSAGTVSGMTEVTTSDDYLDEDGEPILTKVNTFYVMNPEPAYAPWSYFVTWNGIMYQQTGNPDYVVDDSGWEAEVVYFDVVTGAGCVQEFDLEEFLADGTPNPDFMTQTNPTCAQPYAPNGGRIVFDYAPTCVPVIEAMEVQTEFVGIAGGDCAASNGDVDGDGSIIVNDIIQIVQHILGGNLLTDEEMCRGDISGDGEITVTDIVMIVGQILNGRGEAATSAEFNRVDNALEMNANGIVDAVQITLSHSDDFNIELTDKALVAEYSTKDNQTTLIIVAPEGNEIFTASGEYVIDEVVAANMNGNIPTSMPVSFNLSEAYPNPFNPSTSLDITLSNEGSVSIVAYNVMGQMVGTLHEGGMSAGSHTITWDASSLASGMYIIKAEVAGNIVNKKVMLIK